MEFPGGVVKSKKKRKKQNETDSPDVFEKNKKRKKDNKNDEAVDEGFLSGISIFILKAGCGLGKARYDTFAKQVIKNGGKLASEITAQTDYLIVAEEITPEQLFKILNLDKCILSDEIKIVKTNWLSESLAEQKLMNTNEFEINLKQYIANINEHKELNKTTSNSEKVNELNIVPVSGLKWHSPVKDVHNHSADSDDSSYITSDDDDVGFHNQVEKNNGIFASTSAVFTSKSPNKLLLKGDWACAKPSTAQPYNLNKHITDKLQVLQNAYENTKDQWRAFGYKKAINALKKYPTKVTTWEEASRIPGVGSKLADKIIEIVESGHLRKIDHVCKNEEMEALNTFNNIWGVGPTTAQAWVQKGYRTLDDIMGNVALNRQQAIGMKYYHEFLDRMPREEVEEIQQVIMETAHSINSGYVLTTCGSFRRGKPTCGDIDILVSHPDGKSHKGVLGKLLDALRLKHILTDDLVRQMDNGEQSKYMGVCKLNKENALHRRLDIIVSPWNEYHCALVHFTGSDHFNRSLRALAIKKGMSLSEHALRQGVIRRGKEKVHIGTPLPVHSEKDVFTHLGLEYRPPHERDY